MLKDTFFVRGGGGTQHCGKGLLEFQLVRMMVLEDNTE